MNRPAALAVIVSAALLCTACSAAEPAEIPVPEGVDLEAAAEIGDTGNGLWLLDGPVAAGEVIAAMRDAGGVSMNARVHELVPVEQGAPIAGRTIIVTARSDGAKLQAEIEAGDQRGELIVIGQRAWVRGNEAFLASAGASGGDAETFTCAARASTGVVEFAALAEPAEFVRTALTGLEIGVLAPDPESPHTQTLVLGTGGAPTGEVAVDAAGAPLPQRLTVADESGGVDAEFFWGAEGDIRPPDGADACDDAARIVP